MMNTMKRIAVFFKFMLLGMALLLVFYSYHVENETVKSVCTKAVVLDGVVLDTAYLEIEGDLMDPRVIWKNSEVYQQAYVRMAKHLSFENDRLEWDFENAQDVNVSPNIYDYVVNLWNRCNNQLASGKWILEVDGFYYRMIPKDVVVMPLAPQVLLPGNNKVNMNICIDLVKRPAMGWLGNWIDLKNSIMRPDGYGGLKIMGRGTGTAGRVWSYYVTNAKPEEPTHRLNYICIFDSDLRGGGLYERLLNCDGFPLVSVMNSDYFVWQPKS